MLDAVRARRRRAPHAGEGWQARVRQIAESEMALFAEHWWLLHITDQRAALGPGTIAKYDHELHAFDDAGLSDIDRDAALTFVLDFARSSAQARRPDPRAADMAATWSVWGPRLALYLGDDHPLAQRVGAAAGEAMDAAYSPVAAWEFGLARVLDALQAIIG